MNPHHDAARAQLARELGARLGPIAMLDTPDRVLDWERAATVLAQRTMPALLSSDQREAAQAVIDVGCALWPVLGPPDGWWHTPLGRLCAASLAGATPSDEAVRPVVAARMLGVAQPTVNDLCDRGKLDRHPDGGVLLASVYQRLADRA